MSGNPRPVALVTGGSRGIGAATVLRLARDGHDVAFCYRAESDAARQVEKAAVEAGARVAHQAVDVTDPAAVTAWFTVTERELGPVEVVVASAGIVRDGPLVMMKDDDWSSVLSTNLDGTFTVCRAAVFAMMKRRRGCVITLSSVAGTAGNATQTNYAASKAGIVGFTRSLAKEVGRYGIRANVVSPGFIDTDMVSGLSDDRRRTATEAVALRRFGTADEVADAVSYLTRAAYVTGSVLAVDGGITI
jgi:3-oxoacyl-[acyl-carrier protein] reductase